MNINIEQINKEMDNLPLDEWVSCVQQILDRRKPFSESDKSYIADGRYFLGSAIDLGEDSVDSRWDISVVARTHIGGPNDIGLAQGGDCSVCKSTNVSNNKDAQCGVCLSDMCLT